MKTSIKYVTLSTVDQETGGLKALQIRNENGDLRSRLLFSRLDSEVVKAFPPRLYDEILADYMELLDVKDNLMMALETYFVDAYSSIFAAGLFGLQKYFSPDEHNVMAAFTEFKKKAEIGNCFKDVQRMEDVFYHACEDERPELLRQLLEERKALKKEIVRLNIVFNNFVELFSYEDDSTNL